MESLRIMQAIRRTARTVAGVWVALLVAVLCRGAAAFEFRTANFIVTAPDADVARQLALAAETQRRDLALEWLGDELPSWDEPCRITISAATKGPLGATTYVAANGRITRWRMTLRGPLEQVLTTALPHEVSHAVVATFLHGAVPRWADEGMALLAEHERERHRHQLRAAQILTAGTLIPLHEMLAVERYPSDREKLVLFYAQAFAMTEFLVSRGGKQTFAAFLRTAATTDWSSALQEHYRLAGPQDLEAAVTAWAARADR